MKNIIAVGLFAALMMPGLAGAAMEHEGAVRDLVAKKVKAWIESPELIGAVKAQNDKHASISEDEIVGLDKRWRAETRSGDRPLIKDVLANSLSSYLRKVKDGGEGLYTEIFVMDNKGLNVGQSDVTSDYWQGDEAKWKKTYLVGPDAVHIGEIELDESTQMYQTQVSVTVVDPSTKSAIGAVTVGLNVEKFM